MPQQKIPNKENHCGNLEFTKDGNASPLKTSSNGEKNILGVSPALSKSKNTPTDKINSLIPVSANMKSLSPKHKMTKEKITHKTEAIFSLKDK